RDLRTGMLEGALATTLRDALRELSTHSFDAIVVDLRLGRYSGLQLLENLRRLQPQLPLVATAWKADRRELRRMSEAQVLYLRKPYTSEALNRLLAHALPRDVRASLRPSIPVRPQLQRLAREAVQGGAFPALDARALDLQALMAQEDCAIDVLVELLESDVRVTASVLARANAALNRGAATLTTLREACVRLGTRDTFAIALRTLMENAFETQGEIFKALLSERWALSRGAALVARAIAKSARLPPADELYVAALMSHIGELFGIWLLSKREDALLLTDEEYVAQEVAEMEENLGMTLRQRWMLPQRLCEICERTDRADDFHRQRSILHAARTIAEEAFKPEVEDEVPLEENLVLLEILERAGASPRELPALVALARTARER
ncbi:MAG: HDOD domain-containing protein, partial [Myxococcota bacterium]